MTLPEPLERLAATPRLLVALDFDGTLSPLVDEPMTARMTSEAAAAVTALVSAPETTVALVSGRTLEDLRVIAEHDDQSPIVLAGSHGAQWWHPASAEGETPETADAQVDQGDKALRSELIAAAGDAVDGIEGAWIEPKEFGFAVHTRRAAPADAASAHERVSELMESRAPQWRRRTGHSLTEYAYRAEGKDSAVSQLRDRIGATGVLFAGDDVTDEDALRSLRPGDVGVRVGDGETAATVRVSGIAELAELLAEVAHRRLSERQ